MQEIVGLDLARVAAESAPDEYADGAVYLALSRREKNQAFRKLLEDIGRREQSHYDFWKTYAPNAKARTNRFKVYFILLIRLALGLTFTMKFLQRHEVRDIERYKQVAPIIPAVDKARFDELIVDEEHQEDVLLGQIHEGRVKYMSFIVLGLADAVVEISGIHAGSLGIYRLTELAGLAGIVAGMAASIAMAAAAYAQAKQGFEGSAKWSATYTGVSYLFTAILLALPYFLTASQGWALGASLTAGIVLVATMTYYDTVISGRPFKRQFGEIAGIILAASASLYLVGTIVGQLLGIRIG